MVDRYDTIIDVSHLEQMGKKNTWRAFSYDNP